MGNTDISVQQKQAEIVQVIKELSYKHTMKHRLLSTYIYLRKLLPYITVVIHACVILLGALCYVEAAVSPNGQEGACGPYYIWYQVSADNYGYALDYVDLCGITFDTSDVVDDFDFVSLDTGVLKGASLDEDHDGISDLNFFGREQNQLIWQPETGCTRINLRECQGSRMDKRCGYAMINVQPKYGFREGSASIPIHVIAKCPPNGIDCNKNYTIQHTYSNCIIKPDPKSVPDFILRKEVDRSKAFWKPPTFQYTITIRNTTSNVQSTVLTDTVTEGTEGGELLLSEIKIEQCPVDAICKFLHIIPNPIKISFENFSKDQEAKITYTLKITDTNQIHTGKTSYFTNTAVLSNGGSAQVIVHVLGTGSPAESKGSSAVTKGDVDTKKRRTLRDINKK